MKWLASALIASVILPSALIAKGLDKLQPDTEEPSDEGEKDNPNSSAGEPALKSQDEGSAKDKGEKLKDAPEAKKEGADKEVGAEKTVKTAEVKPPEVPVEPGFQQAYIGTSLSLINLKGSSGSWHSSATGDLEAGYRLWKAYQNRYDIYGTFRYRPTDVTVEKDQRAYRGIAETFLFGLKAQTEVRTKLFAVGSVELGRGKAALHAIDGIAEADGGLEKSGVDLSIGGGVSYLVLDKIALGTQIHLGLGVYKSTQFGVDLRFLL